MKAVTVTKGLIHLGGALLWVLAGCGFVTSLLPAGYTAMGTRGGRAITYHWEWSQLPWIVGFFIPFALLPSVIILDYKKRRARFHSHSLRRIESENESR